MKLYLIFLFFILCKLTFSQDSIVIHGEIKVRFENISIGNAQIVILPKNEIKIHSSTNGYFELKIPFQKKVELYISHPEYNDEQKLIVIPQKDTMFFKVEMTPIKKLEDVTIHFKRENPEKVFGDTLLSVADFELMNNGKIILLAYPKRLTKGSQLLLWDKKIESEFSIDGISEELVRDFRGNPHLICSDKVIGIQLIDGKSILTYSIEKEYFKKYLAPILDTNKTKMYFTTFNKDYPAFTYFTYDQLDSSYSKIIEITDELMMELYRSEYKWADVRTKIWAKQKEIETGIEAVIWVGANYFTKSVYYKELYAPLFHRNDTLFVFDYYKDKLLLFNQKGERLDSISITHHYHPKETGWKKKLIQDRLTGQIYAITEIAGYSYLTYVNTQTGKLESKVKLGYRYVEKIEIYNNEVFYIYRPFESIQKKYLYKEKLPFNFEKAKVPQGDERKN
jgi:hypothetical protein